MTILTYYNIKKNNCEITKFSDIRYKGWFLVRTFGNYFCYNALILSIVYLRAATASCIAAGDPFVIIALSIFIRHEKFYIRYIVGIIVCFIGTAIILLNEKHGGSQSVGEKANIPLGLFFGICHFIIDGCCVFAQKIIVSEGITTDVQVFYTGAYNFLTALFVCFFDFNFGLNLWMILVATVNSFIFYFAQYLTDKALKVMDAANYSPSAYVQTLFTFILGVIFFGESFYFSDAFVSFLIVAFHVYNAYDPIKETTQ